MRTADWDRMRQKTRIAFEKLMEVEAVADRSDVPPVIGEHTRQSMEAVKRLAATLHDQARRAGRDRHHVA